MHISDNPTHVAGDGKVTCVSCNTCVTVSIYHTTAGLLITGLITNNLTTMNETCIVLTETFYSN